MEVDLAGSWAEKLQEEVKKPYFKSLCDTLSEEYASKIVYPSVDDIFKSFRLTAFESVRVVIVGQDPYHGEGEANGLAFSVSQGVKVPPSLRNIKKEIESEYDCVLSPSGDLTSWAKQGVLLLNATLTVEADKAGSHQGRGWEEFTDAVIETINRESQGVVFLLWGSYAQRKGRFIDRSKHRVLTSAHPSPLAAYRGFFGNNHFRLANDYLVSMGRDEIDWLL
ncbi:MAG: uracil-DNA glycosylase [Bacteroidales bacterium]